MADSPRIVWFYRDYQHLTGGHLKHSHYFGHVRSTPGFRPKLMFNSEQRSPQTERERQTIWAASPAELTTEWQPATHDAMFLAGTDWRYLDAAGLARLPNPRINFIQHVRHAHVGSELYGYLGRRAIRICVSQEVADAIIATKRTNGPVLTIPNGVDVALAAATKKPDVPPRLLIVGYKRPELARALSSRLQEEGIAHQVLTGFRARQDFLDCLARCDVAICLPHEEEGFYLPALEAMASGCVTITLDCIGNRGFCHHRGNCLMAEATVNALTQATKTAFDMIEDERREILANARKTVAAHSLAAERERFQAILRDVDRLWQSAAGQ